MLNCKVKLKRERPRQEARKDFAMKADALSSVNTVDQAIQTIVCGSFAGLLARLSCATTGTIFSFWAVGEKAPPRQEAVPRGIGRES